MAIVVVWAVPATLSLAIEAATKVPLFTRTLLVATLVLVVLQHRSLGVSKLAAMLREGTHRLRHLLLGVAIAAGVSLLALWGMVVAGDLQWRDDKAWLELLEKLVVVGGIAVVVALLEESLFRVLIYRGLRATLGTTHSRSCESKKKRSDRSREPRR